MGKSSTRGLYNNLTTHWLLHDHRGLILTPYAPAVLQTHVRGLLHKGFSEVDTRFGGRRQFSILGTHLGGQIVGNDGEGCLRADPGKQRIRPTTLPRPLLPGVWATNTAMDTHTHGWVSTLGKKRNKTMDLTFRLSCRAVRRWPPSWPPPDDAPGWCGTAAEAPRALSPWAHWGLLEREKRLLYANRIRVLEGKHKRKDGTGHNEELKLDIHRFCRELKAPESSPSRRSMPRHSSRDISSVWGHISPVRIIRRIPSCFPFPYPWPIRGQSVPIAFASANAKFNRESWLCAEIKTNSEGSVSNICARRSSQRPRRSSTLARLRTLAPLMTVTGKGDHYGHRIGFQFHILFLMQYIKGVIFILSHILNIFCIRFPQQFENCNISWKLALMFTNLITNYNGIRK